MGHKKLLTTRLVLLATLGIGLCLPAGRLAAESPMQATPRAPATRAPSPVPQVLEPPKIRGSAFLALDQDHQGFQLQLSNPVNLNLERRSQIATTLERMITYYEKVMGAGPRSLQIGLLLSDLGEARTDQPMKIRALSAAVPILAAHLGQDRRIDLAYAQAVDRLAEALAQNPIAARDRVTPTLMTALKLLASRKITEAEAALLAQWSKRSGALELADSPNSSRIPGFEAVVQHAALAAESGRSRCTRFHEVEFALANQLKQTGREREARELASRSFQSALAAVQSGCGFDWSPNLADMDTFVLPRPGMATLLLSHIRRHIRDNPGEPARAGEGMIEDLVAALAEVGTPAQLQSILPLLRGNSTIWANAGENLVAADLVARLARFRWLGGSWGKNPRGAAALLARLPGLRPSTPQQRAGGWGRASDLALAAEFHASAGSRTRATELARILAYRFPAAQVSPGERASALFILARNAADEGDAEAAGRLLAEAANLPVPGTALDHLRRVIELTLRLPPESRAPARAAILALAGRVIPANLQPRRGNNGAPLPHGFEFSVLQAAALFSDQALFDRVRTGSGAIGTFLPGIVHDALVDGREVPAWLLAALETAIAGDTGQDSLGAAAGRLLAKDYAGILAALPPGLDAQGDCDFGSKDMLRYVATERLAGRVPNVAGAKATLDRIFRPLCAGNSIFSMDEQQENWRRTGLFWRAVGELAIAKVYIDLAPDQAEKDPNKVDLVSDAVHRPEAVFEQLDLARLRMEMGDIEGAARAAAEMTRMIAARLRASGAALDQVRESSRFREALDLHLAATVRLVEQPGKPVDAAILSGAFNAIQLRRATGATVAAARLSSRLAAQDPALAAGLRQRQDASERVEILGRQFQATEDDAARLRVSAALKSALEDQERINQTLARRFPKAMSDEGLDPLPLADAQGLLRPGEALVVSATTRDEVLFFVATRDRAGLVKANLPRAGIEDSLRLFREGVTVVRGDSVLPRFRTAEARRLHDALIQPLLPLLGGVEDLTLVLDGPLESLPFAALVESEESDRPRYLIERFGLSHLPGIRALALPGAKANRTDIAYLGIGDPRLGPPDATLPTRGLGRLDPGERARSVMALPSLPASRDEIEQVSRRFPGNKAMLLLGPDATEQRIKRERLAQYRILHFATHAVVANELQGVAEPGIALTPPERPDGEDDGLLTATEIGALDLAADLVILSACNTAASDGRPNAEGLSGLARAFITAGARSLLVSHWSVLSGPTSELMAGFAEASAAGAPPPVAMRKAMRSMLANSGAPESQHPVAWAPFIVVGR